MINRATKTLTDMFTPIPGVILVGLLMLSPGWTERVSGQQGASLVDQRTGVRRDVAFAIAGMT